jgi:hypothetical protein
VIAVPTLRSSAQEEANQRHARHQATRIHRWTRRRGGGVAGLVPIEELVRQVRASPIPIVFYSADGLTEALQTAFYRVFCRAVYRQLEIL